MNRKIDVFEVSSTQTFILQIFLETDAFYLLYSEKLVKIMKDLLFSICKST